MAIAQLSIDLVAKIASFERDLKRAADATVSQSSRMTQAFSLVGGGLAGIATGFSVGAIASFVKSSINAVDELNDLKDATGASVENLSALQDIASRTGTDVDTVSTSLVKFNAVLKDADPSKGPGAVIKALGLSIEDLKRQDPAEAMRQVAVAFQGITDEGGRARAVQELFGKSVKEVAPYLKDLAENGTLVAKVTTQQAEEAERFNKELFKLQTNAANAARTIALALVPAINKIFDDVRTLGDKASLAGLATDVTGLAKQLKELQTVKVSAVFVPNDIDKQIAAVTAKLADAKTKFNAAVGTKDPREALRGMDRNIPFKDIVIPDTVSGGSGGGRAGRSSTATPKDPFADANRYLESLRKQLQATQELSVYEKLLADLRVGSLGKTTPALEAQLKLTAQQIDADKELAEISKEFGALNQQASDRVRQKEEDRQRLLKGLLDATPTAQIEAQRDVMLTLAAAYENGELGITGSTQALQRYTEAAQTFLGTGAPAMDEMATSALRASERIQDALGETLVDVLSGDFDNIGDKFGGLLQRMAAEAAAAQIMDSLFGKVNAATKQRSGDGLLSSATDFLGSLLSFDGGGYTGAGARAGGLDGKGGFLGILHPQEDVIDRTKGRASAAGQVINVTQNFTVGDVATLSQVRQAVAGAEARIAGAAQRSQKYGGAFA